MSENREQLIDAINQIFSIFRINYHNQFYAAFSDDEKLNSAKKLWLHSLAPFKAETLLQAANHLVCSSEYLPTLSRFINECDATQFQLPSAREAYLEACNAENKSTTAWSHPVIYYAGKACGWHLLRNEPETRSWPVFKEQYIKQCEKVRLGEVLSLPPSTASNQANKESAPIDLQQQKKRLAELKATL